MGRKILADAGYEVITVNNGSAALKKIGEQRPDLIVLDVYMPGYSGLEVCQRLKETGDTSRIPILLTVGKLEPFKPEEARRVRADGFIVKPFEASELLSALAKLEDKIVPRSETSKPGRFSRAIHEDSRYDKTMATEEDVGWKNRISFPTKKKEKEKEEVEADEPVPVVHARKVEEERVDMGALAAAGLPRDVTPEEIAALAAAAARVKGKIADPKPAEPSQELAVVAPSQVDAQKQEVPIAETVATAKAASPAAIEAPKSEVQTESHSEQKTEPKADEVSAAIANLQQDAPISSATSGNGSSPHADSLSSAEPVTMAMGAAAGADTLASRWTAVAVALPPEEAAISLEHEMQKAYAAFATAESGHSGAAMIPQSDAAIESMTPSENTAPESSVSVPAIMAPEVAQTLSAVANAATEAVSAAVQELENVANSYAGQSPVEPSSTTSVPEIAHGPSADAVAAPIEQPKSVSADTAAPQSAPDAPPSEESKSASATGDFVSTVPDSTSSASAISSETIAKDLSEPAAASPPASEPKEPDTTATTAAAWASWKKSSADDGDAAPALPVSGNGDAAPHDTAAMAAAVGGKNSLEELVAAAENDPEIASIVDSVLADLRPKIVEEISRKLGKKK
jgi:CheY-like chemotaxis protein